MCYYDKKTDNMPCHGKKTMFYQGKKAVSMHDHDEKTDTCAIMEKMADNICYHGKKDR